LILTGATASGIVVAAALLSYVVVEGVRRWSVRNARFDRINKRSSHSTPTPRGGGIAITTITIAAFLALAGVATRSVTFAAAAAIVGVISFLDDLRSLSARVRFAAHIAAALVVVLVIGYIRELHVAGTAFQLGIFGLPLTVFWIIGMTNAYNFMDGIDGIAGGQAVIAAAGWVALGVLTSDTSLTVLALLVCGSSAGFLAQNWPPAKIFMGDVGSAFLGFTFAVLPLVSRQGAATMIVPSALLVWPFLFDTTLTFVRRLRRGENVFAAHRSHLYQRLVIAGYRHVTVTSLYVALATLGAAAAVVWPAVHVPLQAVLLTAIGTAALALWRFVLRAERQTRIAA
jgi:Fuc2NAc and GlcNAc transferase